MRHPGRALDLKTKYLIGYLWTSLFIDQSECLLYHFFCIKLPLFCTVLRKNCTVLSQSESSDFSSILLWMKIWHVNSSEKTHSLSPSHIWKLGSFFLPWKAVFTHSWIEELDHKAEEKVPAVMMRLSCQMFFEWLWNCVQETIEPGRWGRGGGFSLLRA